MTDYWKSNDRKYCDFCKCWIGDNKASISFHENGKRHKMNVTKRINLISRNSEKAERDQRQMEIEIRKMEKAAMCSYVKDIQRDLTVHSLTSCSDNSDSRLQNPPNVMQKSNVTRQVDPLQISVRHCEVDCLSKPMQNNTALNSTLWVENKSDEGYTYYWNVKTKESVWEKPAEGCLSWKEFQKINELAVKREETRQIEEAKQFRENINENVARYNRERLKFYRVSDISQNSGALADSTKQYKTEEEMKAPAIGSWLAVNENSNELSLDLQLPKLRKESVTATVLDLPPEPSVKRFKEKTIQSLNIEEGDVKPITNFKKRRISIIKSIRKPLKEE